MINRAPFLRIGLLGAGLRGRWLASLCTQSSGSRAQVVACCDVFPDALEQCRVQFGNSIHRTDKPEKFVQQNLDAIVIATPDFLHERHAILALRSGAAVYLEKPMALDAAGCDRILDVAVQSGSRLYVGHNMRHMPFVTKMRELIQKGVIGQVTTCWARHFVGHGGDYYFRDWHAERKYTNGLLLQKGAHDVDIIHWLCGGYSRVVHAFGALTVYGSLPRRKRVVSHPPRLDRKTVEPDLFPATRAKDLNRRVDVEDLSLMQMTLGNGVIATYSQCHYTPDYWRNYTVIGTEGRIENFGNGEPGTRITLWNRRKKGYDPYGDRTYEIQVATGSHGGADKLIIAEFLRFVRRGGQTKTSPLAARESVAATAAGTESLRAGGAMISVPPPPRRLVAEVERLAAHS